MDKLEELAKELLAAKKTEDNAKSKRIEIEEKIAALVKTGDNESKTVSAGDLRLTVKRALNYKADVEALAKGGFKDILVVVPRTYELDEDGYENLRSSDPSRFAQASAFVTVKPRKVSVTLKV